MLYQVYQAHSDIMVPVRKFASMAAESVGAKLNGSARPSGLSNLNAAYEMIARTGLTHTRPPYGIDSVMVGNQEVAVTEEAALVTPFATLLHFKKNVDQQQPRVLIIAPLSGHFATLLRATVRTMLAEHDVYITDWHNARDVALSNGPFSFDSYTAHLIRFLETIGPGAHMVAVCQPCVSALVAASVMAQGDHPAQPRSMTLMAGPIDTRVNPTKVNELAKSKPMDWFEKKMIATVPSRYEGGGRRVYPGFVQLSAFMAMNMDRHIKAHRELYENIAKGDEAKVAQTRTFYDEYFAVLDLAAEFYLETVKLVFQDHALPLGQLSYQGVKVDPAAIKRTMLFTVEGEKDDICAVGQTLAAHDLCTSLRPYRKRHHMQAGVGHYGVFAGRAWQNQIYPMVKNVILQSD
ncbi:MAG: polyhydroxyalkanoate depolymerase [Pseudolabrys sp.]|nr:polyhydroxyalkanoate depolymerase [Pseudolabrys sp.]